MTLSTNTTATCDAHALADAVHAVPRGVQDRQCWQVPRDAEHRCTPREVQAMDLLDWLREQSVLASHIAPARRKASLATSAVETGSCAHRGCSLPVQPSPSSVWCFPGERQPDSTLTDSHGRSQPPTSALVALLGGCPRKHPRHCCSPHNAAGCAVQYSRSPIDGVILLRQSAGFVTGRAAAP